MVQQDMPIWSHIVTVSFDATYMTNMYDMPFLEGMKGKAPLNIITDQDGAMRNAIALVFPQATHRNCRWHILDKASGTVGPYLNADEELRIEFAECLNHTVTPDKFEAQWQAMIAKYGLQGNQNFENLYNIRKCFVAVY